jgi:ATP-dependent DNA helicase RecG
MPTSAADLQFLRLITEEENRNQSPLPIDSLIALSLFRERRRVDRSDLQHAIQKDDAAATRTLEALLERGLVQSHGRSRGTTYTLSPQVYASLGARTEYVRQAGFAELQQDQMVRRYVEQNGSIVRSDVMELCRLTKDQARRLLQRLVKEGLLVAEGDRRWRKYSAAPRKAEAGP